MANPPGTSEIQYKDLIIADSHRAVTLRTGDVSTDTTAKFSDSFITAISRPTCTECYPATYCSGTHAVRLLTVARNG